MIKKTNISKLFCLAICFGVLGFSNYALSQEVQLEVTGALIEPVETQEISEGLQPEILPDSDVISEIQDKIAVSQESEAIAEVIKQEETLTIPQKSESAEQIVGTESDIIIEPENLTQATLSETSENETEEQKLDYTWADFVAQKDCREFVRGLNNNNKFKELAQNLKGYCNTPKMSAWQEWLHTYRQEKKQLLISQTMGEMSPLKYMKVIPYFFFDIQNTNPKGNTPKDLLNKIQQAIIEHQPQEAMDLISKLPENWQKNLTKTMSIGETIVKIKQELNNEQEVQND
jgi:hypothetical protein